MGRDKALLRVGGRTLVARAVDVASTCCDEVALVGRSTAALRALGCPVLADRRPGQGPLGGLETALAWAAPGAVLVLACDLPDFDRRAVRRVTDAADWEASTAPPTAWVASGGGERQPLAAVYSPTCLEVVQRQLAAGDRSMSGLLAAVAVEAIEVGAAALRNVNSVADLGTLVEEQR